ncbi:hypothetical protein MUU53_20360, partial [Rhizobium lemnae]|nr:hypothetical protein [Rhizobium lemnae]
DEDRLGLSEQPSEDQCRASHLSHEDGYTVLLLIDAQWAKTELYCVGTSTDPGRSGRDNLLFLEAVLWVMRKAVRRATYPRC